MYKLNFNHLHYFLTIAKEGSIVKASKKLHITQPALSHQLKNFEQDLGKKLFDRKGKRLVLNDDGRQVLEYGDRIFRQSEEMMEVLKSGESAATRIVKIGVTSWMPKSHVYNFIKPLLFNPYVIAQVFQKDLTTLMREVQTDQLDIVLCDSPYSGRSKKIIGKKLRTEPIVCIASVKDKFRGKFPKLLNDHRSIVFSEASELVDHIDMYFTENKLRLNIIGEMSDSDLMVYTIMNGGVTGFLPESTAKRYIKEKKIKKLGEIKKAQFSTWAIYKKSEKKGGLISSLLERQL